MVPTPTGNGLLPARPELTRGDPTAALVDIEEAGAVFEALGSATARAILAELYRNPAPVSQVAERVGTSLQNASYHLRRLQGHNLVTVVGTWHSSKGVEMDVYAPVNQPLVLVAGDGDSRRALARLVEDSATGRSE
jgi:DNA-binding transcriptional ArsR family regulator